MDADLLARYSQLRDSDPGFVAIHTLLHQLIASVPLILLSTNDIDEAQLSTTSGEGFLVDSCEGGTGVCEQISITACCTYMYHIFESFLHFIAASVGFSSCCATCEGKWGCTNCLFLHYCNQNNESLLAPVGAPLMNLVPINKEDVVDITHEVVVSPPQPTIPATPRTPLQNLSNMQAKRIIEQEKELLEKEKQLLMKEKRLLEIEKALL